MAGKVNAKAKGKDDKSKVGKSVLPNIEEVEDEDFSLLRKPVHTSVTSFGQARKIFDLATEELKSLLSEECDLLYECRVCRNLFRSLANFISHKRVYCKEKFNSTVHGHFIKSSCTLTELSKIQRTEQGYQEWLKEFNDFETMETDEVDERVPLTKDLTAVVEKISINKGVSDNPNEPQVSLQKIPNSSVAMFQNVDNGEENETDNMSEQVNELDTMLCRNVAVLQNDGQFTIQSSNLNDPSVIQISDDEDLDDLKCKKCDMQFSTQKTLKFHMKYKHVDTRLVYPCPDCLEIFATSWSVFRHLFKVHRKSATQIRRLRESIQSKAFKMNNPPAFYEKRKNNMKTAPVQKITEEERLDQENQAWMDNMESDGTVARCGGCGRGFERRAALHAHTTTCAHRTRALRRTPHADTKRIEIQIRKDYNKGPPRPFLTNKLTDLNETKATKDKGKEEKEEPESKEQKKEEEPPPNVEDVRNDDENSADSVPQSNDDQNANPESPEKDLDNSTNQPVIWKIDQASRLPFAQSAEKSNLQALKQRVIGDIQPDKLTCKKCDSKCNNIQELYDHVAKHYKWMRYACKLCNFKHYNFDKLPDHVKIVHKLKGDKDFYFSTVKAIDGPEAVELAEPVEENAEKDETSPNSRRPSRCSSDSSRVSDESSSSSTRVEGARKRKMQKVPVKQIVKRRKSLVKTNNDEEDWQDKDDSPPSVKAFEENSSDMDDSYDKIDKKVENTTSVASRRPVRRKAKPKHADFEYDLSNLLKLEAQGYRESQTVTTKTSQIKKKPQPEPGPNYEILNKECCGALATLSRKAVETFKAHAKTSFPPCTQKEKIPGNVFARPMIPKVMARGDKPSPKKDNVEEKKDGSSNMKADKEESSTDLENITAVTSKEAAKYPNDSNKNADIQQNDDQTKQQIAIKPKNIPSVVPLKFRRQLDVIKNPIINKNISDFTKAGMKTKILVIKPINRKADGTQSLNRPLKFQTIKLKDSKANEDKSSDQVVVVKVPKVDCITRSLPIESDTAGPMINDKAQITIEKSDNQSMSNDKSSEITEKSATEPDKSKTIEKMTTVSELPSIPTEKSVAATEKPCGVAETSNKESIVTEKSIVITQISSPTRDESALVVITEKSTDIAKNQSVSATELKNSDETNGDVEKTKIITV